MLLGLNKENVDHVFLVDFGLSCKYNMGEFKRDPTKAHNGTIEYMSLVSHLEGKILIFMYLIYFLRFHSTLFDN